MSSTAARSGAMVEAQRRADATPSFDGHTRQRMTNVREALRLRRLAGRQRRLCGFYAEHSLFDEAGNCRRLMMYLLGSARMHWRRALGSPS